MVKKENNMTIIGITGRKQNGKDTIADNLLQYGFIKRSFADSLKEGSMKIFGFTKEQGYGDLKEVIDEEWGVTPRQVLQFVGTDLFRGHMGELIEGLGPGFWVKVIVTFYKRMLKDDPNAKLVVPDLRFPDEVDAIHDLGGIVIKVKRPGYDTSDDCHESELMIDKIQNCEYFVDNDGSFEDLWKKVDKIMETEGYIN